MAFAEIFGGNRTIAIGVYRREPSRHGVKELGAGDLAVGVQVSGFAEHALLHALHGTVAVPVGTTFIGHVFAARFVEGVVFFGVKDAVIVLIEGGEDIGAAGGGFFEGDRAIVVGIPVGDKMPAWLALLGEARGCEEGEQGGECGGFHLSLINSRLRI